MPMKFPKTHDFYMAGVSHRVSTEHLLLVLAQNLEFAKTPPSLCLPASPIARKFGKIKTYTIAHEKESSEPYLRLTNYIGTTTDVVC